MKSVKILSSYLWSAQTKIVAVLLVALSADPGSTSDLRLASSGYLREDTTAKFHKRSTLQNHTTHPEIYYTFLEYLFSSREYRTLIFSSSAFSSKCWPWAGATEASSILAPFLGWGTEGRNLLLMRRRMTVWKETSGRRRSTGHLARMRW